MLNATEQLWWSGFLAGVAVMSAAFVIILAIVGAVVRFSIKKGNQMQEARPVDYPGTERFSRPATYDDFARPKFFGRHFPES